MRSGRHARYRSRYWFNKNIVDIKIRPGYKPARCDKELNYHRAFSKSFVAFAEKLKPIFEMPWFAQEDEP